MFFTSTEEPSFGTDWSSSTAPHEHSESPTNSSFISPVAPSSFTSTNEAVVAAVRGEDAGPGAWEQVRQAVDFLQRVLCDDPTSSPFAGHQVFLFGSCAVHRCWNGDSDLDLALLDPRKWREKQEPPLNEAACLEQCMHSLVAAGGMPLSGFQLIAHARVPVLQFRREWVAWNVEYDGDDVPHWFDFDLTMRGFGVRNSALLHAALSTHPLGRVGAIFLNRWSKAVGVNDSKNGLLSSYVLNLMWMRHLVRLGQVTYRDPRTIPVLPGQGSDSVGRHERLLDPVGLEQRLKDLGMLIRTFFFHYAIELKWDRDAISLNRGKECTIPRTAFPEVPRHYAAVCEDPYEPGYNPLRLKKRPLAFVVAAFHEAYDMMAAEGGGLMAAALIVHQRGTPDVDQRLAALGVDDPAETLSIRLAEAGSELLSGTEWHSLSRYRALLESDEWRHQAHRSAASPNASFPETSPISFGESSWADPTPNSQSMLSPTAIPFVPGQPASSQTAFHTVSGSDVPGGDPNNDSPLREFFDVFTKPDAPAVREAISLGALLQSVHILTGVPKSVDTLAALFAIAPPLTEPPEPFFFESVSPQTSDANSFGSWAAGYALSDSMVHQVDGMAHDGQLPPQYGEAASALGHTGARFTGTILSFQQGYGFIAVERGVASGIDTVFVHQSAVPPGMFVYPGLAVSFTLAPSLRRSNSYEAADLLPE